MESLNYSHLYFTKTISREEFRYRGIRPLCFDTVIKPAEQIVEIASQMKTVNKWDAFVKNA